MIIASSYNYLSIKWAVGVNKIIFSLRYIYTVDLIAKTQIGKQTIDHCIG